MVRTNPSGTATRILAVGTMKARDLLKGLTSTLDAFNVEYSKLSRNCATFITGVYKGAGGTWTTDAKNFIYANLMVAFPEFKGKEAAKTSIMETLA
jgi:hypothetical protein